ncbi:MAG: stage II sporulation protein M [Bacteroidales bacterium]|nr:stage II sporulation protein M [Bacteroidales bacterium]
MKESGFIKHNIEKWKTYEEDLKSNRKEPSKISRLFIQITDDLAYAQTFYKNRSVRVYLNGIAQLLFNEINNTRKIKWKHFAEFWKTELPVVMYKIRYELLFSFLIFSLSIAIGIISSVHEPDFAYSILGDKYIEMTKTNIANEDPMAVYKTQNEVDMFLGITLNNIRVALITFILGLFFGLGTLLSLLQNGIMLGTFQYFFIERDLFKESFLTIWQHGSLEISAIVIAGAAGFTIGRGLILPGSYTRSQSLRLSARRGLKVMLGLVPVFIFAAFIEGFFTRHTEVADPVRVFVILASFGFIISYFVVYPQRVAKRKPEKLEVDEKLNKTISELPDLKSIQSGEMLFGGTLKILKTGSGKVLKLILFISIPMAIILSLFTNFFFHDINTSILYEYRPMLIFFKYQENIKLFVINSFAISLLLYFVYSLFNQITAPKEQSEAFQIKFLASSILCSIVFNAVFFVPFILSLVILIMAMPVLLLSLKFSLYYHTGILKGVSGTIRFLNKNFGNLLLLNIKFGALISLLLLLLSPGVYSRLLQFIKWNLWLEDQYINTALNFIACFLFYFGILFSISILVIANSLIFYSLKERQTAECLLERIDQIGIKKTIRGYEIES